MASKGRYVATQSLAERIYWHKTSRRLPYPPTPEAVQAAYERAQAIAKRYQRMKRHATRTAARSRPLPMDGQDFHHFGEI